MLTAALPMDVQYASLGDVNQSSAACQLVCVANVSAVVVPLAKKKKKEKKSHSEIQI